MTGYQKLKAKNKELERIVYLLALSPESAEAREIVFDLRLRRECEDAVMFGRTTLSEKFTNPQGLIKKINTNGNNKP